MCLQTMRKKRNKTSNRNRLQGVTLCISTAMVLILLGMVVFSVLTARNLSDYFKENIVITLTLDGETTGFEASQLCKTIEKKDYVAHLEFISKEQALKEQTAFLGANPAEFIGENPFLSSIELRPKADYANNDSISWISTDLKKYPKVSQVTYQKNLIDSVNNNLQKINIVLLVLAGLLLFVSFSLINNTVRLNIYARRFSIHTMKLVGASWNFIKKPFLKRAVGIGLLASIIANAVLGASVLALYNYDATVLSVVTWQILAITGIAVVVLGVLITVICTNISVNSFLRLPAGELHNI